MKLIYSLNEIDEIAKQIIDRVVHPNILFYGAMGAGKTTLIRALVKHLGSIDKVSSPTFSLVNEYRDIENKPIFHFDFYRINNEEEANQLGLEEYYEAASWTFIEWPSKINSFLPANYHTTILESMKDANKMLKFN